MCMFIMKNQPRIHYPTDWLQHHHCAGAMATTEDAACAACGVASTTRCVGCIEGVDQYGRPLPTYYCTKDCQQRHWPKHRKDCRIANARKVLYRGGELLKTVWLAFREEAFDLRLSRVQRQGDKLHIYEGKYEDTEVLVRYPQHLVSDPVEKQALLSHRACSDSSAYTYELVQKVFEGNATSTDWIRTARTNLSIIGIHLGIVELKVHVPLASCKVVFHDYLGSIDKTQYWHEVFVITLKDRIAYAIDLAGAQYGHQTIMPWGEYLGLTHTMGLPDELGTSMKRIERLYFGLTNPTCGQLLPRVHTEVAKCIERAARVWEQRNGQSLAHMLRSSNEHQYQQQTQQLVEETKKDMHDFIQWAESKGGWAYTVGA